MSSLVNVAPAGVWQSFRGLQLRTHPDADVVASKVMLVRADEIVMHDGVRVADWDRLVADIASAGAGGLDTGSEVASTWYEIHAIRKSSDGTKNLLLHRAKDYFLDESQTVSDGNRSLRLATGTPTDKLAQGFKVDTAGLVEFVDILLFRSGTVTGRIWCTLEADSSGNPSGTALATSDKLDASLVSTSIQWVRVIFRSPASLSAATQYHLVLQGDYARSDANIIVWRGDDTDSYANGAAKNYDGATWSNTSGAGVALDFGFKVYVTRNNTAVTMPSGYDQRAQVGWVYNNASSNFVAFSALDRTVKLQNGVAIVSAGTATFQTLTELSTALPPTPVYLSHLRINVSGAGHVYIGRELGSSWEDFGLVWEFSAAVVVPIGVEVAIEYQALYYALATMASATIQIQAYRW